MLPLSTFEQICGILHGFAFGKSMHTHSAEPLLTFQTVCDKVPLEIDIEDKTYPPGFLLLCIRPVLHNTGLFLRF